MIAESGYLMFTMLFFPHRDLVVSKHLLFCFPPGLVNGTQRRAVTCNVQSWRCTSC